MEASVSLDEMFKGISHMKKIIVKGDKLQLHLRCSSKDRSYIAELGLKLPGLCRAMGSSVRLHNG